MPFKSVQKFLLIPFVLLGLAASPALSQSLLRLETTNSSGTIAVTNTFQSVASANSYRKGCLIQNTGSNTMWVFFGPIASATKAKSVVLSANASVSCTTGNGVLGDQISITGTATDTFYAGIQN